jgi:hypothetical protein
LLSAIAFGLVAAFIGVIAWHIIRQPQPSLNEPTWMREAREREEARRMPKWTRPVIMIAALGFAIGLGMEQSAGYHNPSTPDPATGHIYEVNVHGSYSYVTREEYFTIHGFIVGSWAVGFASMAYGLAKAKRSLR